ELARKPRQRGRKCIGEHRMRQVDRIDVSFTGAASDHQGARAHEARPDAPHRVRAALGQAADAAEQVLIDDETGLDRAYVAAALDHQVAVAEAVRERVFEQFVETVILALTRECTRPARQPRHLGARGEAYSWVAGVRRSGCLAT